MTENGHNGHHNGNGSVHQPTWRFLTSHAQILLAVHRDSEIRMRDLADEVGVTERRAQEIVSELVAAGFLERERIGRHNRYMVRADLRIRHPDWGEHNLGDVLSLAAMWTGLRPGDSKTGSKTGGLTGTGDAGAGESPSGWTQANGMHANIA
jgi:hypothetical protein